jgi:hypothetical protein
VAILPAPVTASGTRRLPARAPEPAGADCAAAGSTAREDRKGFSRSVARLPPALPPTVSGRGRTLKVVAASGRCAGHSVRGRGDRRATEQAIVYEHGRSHELPGKSGLIPLWRTMRVVSGRRGTLKADGLVRRPGPRAAPPQGSLPRERRGPVGAVGFVNSTRRQIKRNRMHDRGCESNAIRLAKRRRLARMTSLMAKIRKWLGMGKKA